MRWYGIIDRFEANKAVILSEESELTLTMDRSLIPMGSREGDRVRFDLSIEDDDRESRKKHAQDLIDQLSRKTGE